MKELIIDNFAGGGGASEGIELATKRKVDIAINHDPSSIRLHKTNHPNTKHYCENVWDVDPVEATQGQPVALCWFSPDCKHFSRAKGKTPVDKKIRGLAWVAVRWASKVKPRVIILENVPEFKTWCPVKNDRPVKSKKGETFHKFINALERLGYKVEYKELKACDYGAPTTRKRFFLIARCDNKPIVFPEPTHGENKIPYIPASEIIDWDIEVPSIFNRKKPLSENTLVRIARGINKFIIEDKPYIVNKSAYFLTHYYTHQGLETRGSSLRKPINTIPTANRFGLVRVDFNDIRLPDNEELYEFLKYYGSEIGQSLNRQLQKINDIGLRMLTPRELFRGQGFPESYVIDRDYKWNLYPKTEQVARCGNSVPPILSKVLVESNLPELCGISYSNAI
ncbi:TPA: DNA cytosine methyltransferase [Clostridioides difficile]|uniref:DNA (cytosine-5-)-methyltransferase n=1 Tax=Clostridioides difficile TaxID=1496 RepID=A0AB74QI33_CLODI|nr:DNA (cytosine-5-)-methyltransferase [Clostridioides difficile]MBY2049339.1 DNA (cytosine-5-)-methyltransferase [Clostridioides difficile]MCD8633487.1 DNA (cytosine-5-)-methyltransferase [Clostridioides difficile]MCF2715102.1 DNA cytosine methyltransferase [Clostridioides difficile]MCI4874946.1 DNA (cytosine-5-)-methyltransferase [Clostridioides difficile]MCO4710047.1 DNA (cytosine-5-)-methyltransferase [Clostridioides difficile]